MIDFFSILLHMDQYLTSIVGTYGILVYAILFAIIFLETGLVVTPFLPGDSLIFVAGALAAAGLLGFTPLLVVMVIAAILGDTANYWIGHKLGRKASEGKVRFISKKHVDRSMKFYKKYGKKTIVMARFVPIIRTFAPFVAGIAKMDYRSFLSYNVVGGIAWVSAFLAAGYFFGNLDIVKNNLSAVIISIIVITLIPPFVELFRSRK
ncbi:MAG TPA: VTT domain-containing protein [archaeon]|nr:VTT domain-containing protein [archaeon]